ncbi:MAG TPA: Flp pilus assembly protein CpaB [Tepidisphaeraceae bacterium]|jgi:pilus assembly protein CpaB|nr:Flp pilus assembly protein CpaB [Tepidisphaeraceae bacterium]
MKLKTWLPAILAVVLGGAAAFLVRNSMKRPNASPQAIVIPKMIPAVIATSDLMAGQEIIGENLEVTQVASSKTPQGLISNPVELVGRVLSAPVAKGQPIHEKELAPRGVAANLPSLVPAGMRAMTINVDEGNSLSGMLMPGCHVDVIATIAAGQDSITRTLVSNVLVQATGQRLSSAKPEDGKEPPPFHTVTLIVSPRDGQLLDLAGVSARIRLLLRPLNHNADDLGNDQVTMAELKGGNNTRALPVAVAPTTQPAPTDAPKLVSNTPNRNDVTLILGQTITHVKVEMPEPVVAPVITEIPNSDRQPLIPEGREPNQD